MRTRDGLPEVTSYQDDGCDIHPACLSCPLPACRYELPPGRARAISQALQLEALLRAGSTMAQAAAQLGVSRRTVYRLRSVDQTGRTGQRQARAVQQPVSLTLSVLDAVPRVA